MRTGCHRFLRTLSATESRGIITLGKIITLGNSDCFPIEMAVLNYSFIYKYNMVRISQMWGCQAAEETLLWSISSNPSLIQLQLLTPRAAQPNHLPFKFHVLFLVWTLPEESMPRVPQNNREGPLDMV